MVLRRLQQDAGLAGASDARPRLGGEGADEARHEARLRRLAGGEPGAEPVAERRIERPRHLIEPGAQDRRRLGLGETGGGEEGGVEIGEAGRGERGGGDVEGDVLGIGAAREHGPPLREQALGDGPLAPGGPDALQVVELHEEITQLGGRTGARPGLVLHQ